MQAATHKYRAIAHNLANANTAGYKRILSEAMAAGGGDAGGATVVSDDKIDFSQGGLVETGRPLDVALSGPGFFVIETPEGPMYTRHGVLHVSSTGQLVDASGRTVAGASGPIILPQNAGEGAVDVTTDGRVTVGGAEVGQLRVVEFEKPEVLLPAGLCAFAAPKNVETKEAAKTTVQQGFQEASNVSVVNELVDLIAVTRLYEANARAITQRGEGRDALMKVALG
jgi:flagellar basal body rod protein FlgG